jgi:uncharacterized protein (TIGR02284 family)
MENSSTVSTLNDLVAILNDRIEGYTTAKHELDGKEPDLNSLFLDYIDESRKLRNELGVEIDTLKGDTTNDTTERGKLYRFWMDLKAAFSGDGRHAVLASCEYGEDYKHALEEKDLPRHIYEMIERQKQTLRGSHDQIKALRDASK